MLRHIIFILLITGVSVFPGSICSSQEKLCPTGEDWNPPSAGPVTTWPAPLCGKGAFVIQPFFLYNRTLGVFDAHRHYDSLPKGDRQYQYQEQVFAQYGITDKIEIDAQIVYQENYVRQGGSEAGAKGFGDNYLFLRYCALEEKGRMPHITFLAQFKVPTGKYQHADPDKLGADLMGAASGGGSFDQGFGITLTKKLKSFIFHSDAIYNFPQPVRIDGVKTCHGNYLSYDLAVEYFLPKGFNLILEANEFLQDDEKQNGEKVPLSGNNSLTIGSGIGWSNDKIQTLLAYQRLVEGTNTEASDSLILTCVYTF